MRLEETSESRALSEMIETRKEIEAAFNEISYQKAAAVLNMVQNFLGEKIFRNGLASYIQR